MKLNKLLAMGIGKAVALGYFIVIALVTGSVIFSLGALRESLTIDAKISEVYLPTLNKVNNLEELAVRSRKLSNNWVFMPNPSDQEALRILHADELPALENALNELSEEWENPAQQEALSATMADFSAVVKMEKEVMAKLTSFEDFDDDEKVDAAIHLLEKKIEPAAENLSSRIASLHAGFKETSAGLTQQKINSFENLRKVLIAVCLLTICMGGLVTYGSIGAIVRPIKQLQQIISRLGKGEISKIELEESRDEIGQMVKAVKELMSNLERTSDFASQIGKGNLNSEYESLGESDILGNSLISMRNDLKKVAADDETRNWSVEGMARVGEMLRKNQENLISLGDMLVADLVKYLKANQGALFIMADEKEHNEEYLKLLSCYAWNKKKFVDLTVHKGEGLVGQSWQEGETIYITEVPETYVKITSGLGQATPRSVLIVPLRVNDNILGVLELAALKEFKPFEIDFIEKIAESIASTISSVRINNQTRELLEGSQSQAEEMRAQEEEMRQNQEEMLATQEEMARQKQELEEKINLLEGELQQYKGTPERV